MASFTVESQSITEFDGIDYMPKRVLHDVGQHLLAGFPAADAAFAEPAKAPDAWFTGLDGVTERILVSAGALECMRDDILRLGEVLKKHHPNIEILVQDGAVHDDMVMDFMTKEKKLGAATAKVVDWLATGWS
jgi:acetyl esterase/lipase